MASGAVFQLLTNDGKADKLLFASKCLKDRICRIANQRDYLKAQTKLPSIKDIEQTHTVWFHNRFKPIVAIAFEYQKVKQRGGTTTLTGSSSVDFDIPLFGEFYIDMVLNVSLTAASQAGSALPAIVQPAVDVGGHTDAGATSSTFTIADLSFGDQSAPSAYTPYTGYTTLNRIRYNRYVDEYGATLIAGSTPSGKVFYADYPGEILVSAAKIDVLGNPLDDYDSYSYAWKRKFKLTKDKEAAYCRCVGQEVPIEGSTFNCGTGIREKVFLLAGNQTPKESQPAQNWWIPMLWWFCENPQDAFASAPIPQGKKVEITFGKQEDILFTGPMCWREDIMVSDTYADTVVSISGTTATVSAGTAAPINGGTVSSTRSVIRTPIYSSATPVYPTISQVTLYVNNLFTLPELHDIYVARTGFQLIRIHRIQRLSVNSTTFDLLLSQFKYPIESLYCGIMPDSNHNASSKNCATDWHMFSYVVHHSDCIHSSDVMPVGTSGTGTQANTTNVGKTVNWPEQLRIISTMGIMAQGVSLFDTSLPAEFYNSYVPYKYGQGLITAPTDVGANMISFCLFPGISQISGHVNTSRVREFYLDGTCQYMGSVITSGQMNVEGTALNFLLQTDGTAILRYST